MSTIDVRVRVGPTDITIRINGLPHVMLRREHLSAIDSWERRIGVVEPKWAQRVHDWTAKRCHGGG